MHLECFTVSGSPGEAVLYKNHAGAEKITGMLEYILIDLQQEGFVHRAKHIAMLQSTLLIFYKDYGDRYGRGIPAPIHLGPMPNTRKYSAISKTPLTFYFSASMVLGPPFPSDLSV